MTEKKNDGLVIVYTGNGKGKTTAAVGLLLRAWGTDRKIKMLQFIKSGKRPTGERIAAERIGVEILPFGDGFTWLSKDLDRSKALAVDAWEQAQRDINSGEYDVVILDELTYTMTYLWIETKEIVDVLKARPSHVNVVITGRAASDELIEAADLVTEMREIKHPYHDRKLPAQEGIDF
jgi:cob(I)alamin adenosyltransferase